MKNQILIMVCLFSFGLMDAQEGKYLGAELALQKSEIIKAVPQESNGFLVMHKDNRVDYWVVRAIEQGEVQSVFQTNRGENHIQMDQEVYSNWGYSYQIQGMSTTGETILDIDVMPAIDNPTWIYNDCNRPRCVKTSGNANYAYGIDVYEHVSNDSYKLSLNKAWSHIDTGMQIPYYIEVSQNNLNNALGNQNLTIANGIQSPQTYFWDNGMYKVALGLGVWHQDWGETTNQINGTGGEGCSISFNTAKNRMNTSAQLSSSLTCSGQQYSQNQGGGGDSPFSVGSYANASASVLDCNMLSLNYNWEIDFIDAFGIIHYVWVVTSSSINVDCDQTPTSPGGPCPPGYYYAPGGGDPCKPIEPIIENLKSVSLIPIDVVSDGEENTIEQGLYLTVLNYAEGISIPIYKKIEESITLQANRSTFSDELIVFPNPSKDQIMISLSQGENITAYSIFDHLGNEVKRDTFSLKLNEQTLDLTPLNEGVYFLNVESVSSSYTKTIIKE